jgi:radical SAM protein with 4Fe4S-binding SPASM domain
MRFPLRRIIFEVTQECNLSCLYCYNYWRRKGFAPRQATFKQANSTLLKLLKTIDFEHITFTGGEPFLANGLLELVLKCRMNRKDVTIITNGTTATYNDYQLLNDMGVSLFELPLHSRSEAIHDRMTGKAGSFHNVIESIRVLSKLKAQTCIAVVMTKSNIDCFQDTLEFAEHLGVRRIMIARFNIGGRGIENSGQLLPSLKQLRNAFRIANDFAQHSTMKISANVCVPFCIINPNDFPNIPISSCNSHAINRPVALDFSGDMRMCNHSPHIIGNIHTAPMEDIFNSSYVKSWDVLRPDYCSDCAQWIKCRGGCRAASEQLGIGLNAEDPIINYTIHNIKTKIF